MRETSTMSCLLKPPNSSAHLNQVTYGFVCADSDYVFFLERQHHQSLYKVLRRIYEQFDFFEEQRLLRCLENLLLASKA